MSKQHQNNISWYANIYYSYRDYPIRHLDIKYKKSQLKGIYNGLIRKMSTNFQIKIKNEQNHNGNNESSPFIQKPIGGLMSSTIRDQSQSQRNSQNSVSLDRQSVAWSQLSIEDRDRQGSATSRDSQPFQSNRNISSNPLSSSDSIQELKNVRNSKDTISRVKQAAQGLTSTKLINQSHILQICEQNMNQQNRNMDVLYELMIGMIRLIMKRVTVQIDQQVKLPKQNQNKFQIIDEERQKSQNEDDDLDDESEQKSNSRKQKSIINSDDDFKSNPLGSSDENSDYRFVMNYATSLGKSRKKSQSKKLQKKTLSKKQRQQSQKQYPLTTIQYPSSPEQLKFQFLKYCLTTNVPYNLNQSDRLLRNSSQKNKNNSNFFFPQIQQNSSQNSEVQQAKARLQTYFTEITEMDQQDVKGSSQKQQVSEMQQLVMKLACFQMRSFNIFINYYFKKIQHVSTIVNVIGLDAITESMCQMAIGKQARNNGIKTQVGLGNMQVKLFSNTVNQQNSNILLSTWIDLILISQDPNTLYEIIQNLNIQEKPKGEQANKQKRKTWTPSICNTPLSINNKKANQKQEIMFKQKMLSLLNFLILSTTKNVLIQSISKANFLSIVVMQMLSNRHDRRSLKQFQLRKLKDSQMCQPQLNKNRKDQRFVFSQDQAILVYDLTYQKQLWMKQSLDMVFNKWKKVIQIIFEQQVKNQLLYWQLIFQKCVTLINKQLSLLTVLVFNLVQIIENLNIHIKSLHQATLYEDGNQFKQFNKRQIEKYDKMKTCIQLMIKQLIGCCEIFGIEEGQMIDQMDEKMAGSFECFNTNIKQFYRMEHGSKLINREENAKQLIKWEEIIKQNIVILQSYIHNVELISSIFENKPYYTASWVVNFHIQSKKLLGKVKAQNLQLFYQKFYYKISNLWNNLNCQGKQQQQEKRSPALKRKGVIARQRISSIKGKKQLNYVEKQALIINYMIKAQLQLYQSYTKSHVLNCRQQSSTMTTIVSGGTSSLHSNRPFIFQDSMIQSLLIFDYKNVKKQQNDIASANLFVKRSSKVQLTLKHLSNFAPSLSSFPTSPRKSPKMQKKVLFKKKVQVGLSASKAKQFQSLKTTEYQIDVGMLEIINYSGQQIRFLQELMSYLRFINQINFQYQFYYWKNVLYERRFNLKNNDYRQVQTSLKTEDQKSQSSSIGLLQSKQKKQPLRLKRMMTINEYTRQKIEDLLTTQQLYKQLSQINKSLPGSREEFTPNWNRFSPQSQTQVYYEKQLNARLLNYKSGDSEQKESLKTSYKEKVEEICERVRIHNQSLALIVNAALQAKNYWKAVASNVFPDDEVLNIQRQQYIVKNQNKLQKNSTDQIQINFQKRFFQKKILEKLEQYINHYRQISKQMNYTIYSEVISAQNMFVEFGQDLKSDKNVILKGEKGRIPKKDSEVQSGQRQIHKNQFKRPSIIHSIQQNKKPIIRIYSLLQALICKKQQPKMNRFQIAASIYQFSQKILRLNCYMASFYVQRRIYLDIISNQQLSQEKYLKVKIIGKQYFQKIKNYSDQIYLDKQITEQNLRNSELVYQKKVLIVLVSLIQLLYYGNQQNKTVLGKWKHSSRTDQFKSKRIRTNMAKDPSQKQFEGGYKNHGFRIKKSTIKKYGQMLMQYLKFRFKENTNYIFSKQGVNNPHESNTGDQQSKSDYFHISKLFSQVFDFGQVAGQYSQQKFMRMLRKSRIQQDDEDFLKFYILIMEKQTLSLEEFRTQQGKVGCLKKKFNYLILRQIYFFLYYDVDCLQEKSAYSKKNYQLYENRILDFYQQIIKKSYRDFMLKKQMQLRKRSVYLQNYLLKYQQEPALIKGQKALNKLIVCIFNQIMLIYNQDIKLQIKKKSQQVEGLNHQVRKNGQQALHSHFLSCQFYEDKSLFKRSQERGEEQNRKQANNATRANAPHSLASNSQLASFDVFNKAMPSPSMQVQCKQLDKLNKKRTTKEGANNVLLECHRSGEREGQKAVFKVFTIESMNLNQAISAYQQIKCRGNMKLESYLASLKQNFTDIKSLKRDDLTQMEIKTLQTNQQSIVSLFKREIIEKINQIKFQLVQKNLISRIQKLYINLDVRHKVFQSFKDKILSYEMQKAKIYHQYMDYIRGLKLDVYSHIANQDSLPYIKIVNAIKFYRLSVKKQELQNKVRQQFGKNLQKWNQGIQQDLMNYNQWLDSQQKQWQKAQQAVSYDKNYLLLIYDSIRKELTRQSKKRQLSQNKYNTYRKQKTQIKPNQQTAIQNQSKELKKVPISKNASFIKQKLNNQSDHKTLPFKNSQIVAVTNLYKDIAKEAIICQKQKNTFLQINLFKKSGQIQKINSSHTLNNRVISKYSSNQVNQGEEVIQRPTTSFYNQNRMSGNTKKSRSRDINRASTAVTRQKSFDFQNNQFRGIKMKFISKSLQKFVNNAQSSQKQGTVFKRSTQYQGFRQRNSSGHQNTKVNYFGPNLTSQIGRSSANQIGRNSANQNAQSKSRTLLKQGRCVKSALPQRKGIIKNF